MTARRVPQTEALEVDGPAGRLEALLERSADAEPDSVAVVCHPHPLQGGTMHNKVVYTLARAMLRRGAATLRFNFRGVGVSEGQHADGPGEIDDARAAVDFVRARWPGRSLWLAGFSFGAMVALGVAQAESSRALITVAPPVMRIPSTFARPACPWLIVQGTSDDVVPAAEVVAWQRNFEPPPELVLMDDVGHYFDGRLTPLADAVGKFLDGIDAAAGNAEQC